MISFELWIPFKRVERKGNIKAQNVQLTLREKILFVLCNIFENIVLQIPDFQTLLFKIPLRNSTETPPSSILEEHNA